MFAAQHKLDNLTMFVDFNKKQLDGYLDDICSLGDLKAKFEAFGWNVYDIDGHNTAAIYYSIMAGKQVKDKPTVIILNTIKAKDMHICRTCILQSPHDFHHRTGG